MGGHYPTSRGFNPAVATPGRPTFVPFVRRSPTRRAVGFPISNPFRPGSGFQSDLPKVRTFPNPWRPVKHPFGRRQAAILPSPLDFVRRGGAWIEPAIVVGTIAAGFYYSQQRVMNLNGWEVCCDIGGIRNVFRAFENTGPCSTWAASCGRGGQPYWWDWPGEIPAIGPGKSQVLLVGMKTNPSTMRGTWNYVARRNAGAAGAPAIQPEYKYWPLQFVNPWPLGVFQWRPLVPYPMTNPNPPRRVWGPDNRPDREPRRAPKKRPNTSVMPSPAGAPGTRPTIVITRTGVGFSRTPHKYKRDGASKYTVGKGGFAGLALALLQTASNVYNGVTETVDLIKAIYSALPDKVIASQPDNLPKNQIIGHMLETIWQHRGEIDLDEAVYNIASNLIEDAAWGRYFAAQNQIRRRGGPNVEGFDRELSQLNELFTQLYGAT